MTTYQVNVNGTQNYNLESSNGSWKLDGKKVETDQLLIKDNLLHILHERASYRVEVIDFSRADKTASIKVNGTVYKVSLKDQFDGLLQALGLDGVQAAKIAELKAPMPGLVLSLLVKEGESVKKGDNLFVLEAMKMENIIKAPADVSIKSIKIKPGDKVEKNQTLILFAH
ncbi:MAG: Glutaconyl-CoA decarboxylase subunit gamma [Bacteroidota bacterium]|jgi:biotin carboxyl carrier protein